MNKLIATIGVAAHVGLSVTQLHAQEKKMNVLFIAVDDLKPWVGAYGDKHAKTPGMDRLAREGVVFKNVGLFFYRRSNYDAQHGPRFCS